MMVIKALQRLTIQGLLAVAAVLLVVGTAMGSTFYDFQPVALTGNAAGGEAGAGAYLLPPGVGSVTVTVSGFGYLPEDGSPGQFLYVTLAIANGGDQSFTVLPATSSFLDDHGHRVVGAALFSGQTRLTSGTVGPGGRDEIQLGFAMPSDASLASIGGMTVAWSYAYGGQSYVAESKLAKATAAPYQAPVAVYPSVDYGQHIYQTPVYVTDYAYVNPIYVDTYPTWWGGYPWWSWSSFGFGPWWDADLDGDIDVGHFHRFCADGAFVRRNFDRGFARDGTFARTGNVGFTGRGRVVPTDRIGPNVHGLLTHNGAVLGPSNLTSRNMTTLRGGTVTNNAVVHGNNTVNVTPRVFYAPNTVNTAPRTLSTTPRTFSVAPHTPSGNITPRTFNATPHVSTAPNFSAAPRTFSAAPHFSSAPHFSGGGGSTFHSSGGGSAAHFSGGGGGGGGGHGGGHR